MNEGESEGEGEPQEDKPGQQGEAKQGQGSEVNKQAKPENAKPSSAGKAEQQGEFSSEEEALKFMEKMSDQRKKPVRLRRSWGNSGNDW